MHRAAVTFRVTAWLGEPSLLPLSVTGPANRFAWVPFVGVGRLVVQGDSVRFEASRLLRSLWRVNEVSSVEVRPTYAVVREIGPSDFGGNTIYAPFLGSLLARVVFAREAGQVEMQIGVRDRERLLGLLAERGWQVQPYTKTIWPWQSRRGKS